MGSTNPPFTTNNQSNTTMDARGHIRFDFLFSYWVFIWFIIYYFTYKNSWLGQRFTQWGNPKLALILALIENLATLGWIAVANGGLLTLLKYTCMILAMKVLPLYLVWGRPIRVPQDIYVFTGVFVLYNLYLWWNRETLTTIYMRTFRSIVQHDNQTPLFGLVQYLGNVLHIDHAILVYF
jgi:hypothetical protein